MDTDQRRDLLTPQSINGVNGSTDYRMKQSRARFKMGRVAIKGNELPLKLKAGNVGNVLKAKLRMSKCDISGLLTPKIIVRYITRATCHTMNDCSLQKYGNNSLQNNFKNVRTTSQN